MNAAAPARPSGRGFARELTPTWLAATALLSGQRPPDVANLRRYAHLGCGDGVTAAVVAANHPNAEVWAWDQHPEHVEATRRLGDAAGLANLVVHERPDLPLDLGGGPSDVVVVQDVAAAATDDLRARIGTAIRATLRPGGLLCVTYPTTVGWSEIAPVQVLLRQLALGRLGDPGALVPDVLAVLERLRSGGARFLTERPVVAAWLDQLATLDPADVVDQYLRDPLRPMSHAQVVATFAPAGCHFVGSARLTDDLDLDLPKELATEVSGAASSVVRETYRDLAARRTDRLDVLRLGSTSLGEREWEARLAELELAGLAGAEETPAGPVHREAWRQLTSFGVQAGALHADPDQVGPTVRILMDAGQAHPVAGNGPGRAAREACEALNAALAARCRSDAAGVQAVALLGSAISAARTTLVHGTPPSRSGG